VRAPALHRIAPFLLASATLLAAGGAPVITTVVGNGSIGAGDDGLLALESPLLLGRVNLVGIVFDGSGNLFFSEANTHRVRALDAKSGRLVTVAGNGVKGFSGDGGFARDAKLNEPGDLVFDKDGNLLVADSGNNRIRRIALKTGLIDTVIGNGAVTYNGEDLPGLKACLARPNGLALDASGRLLIADSFNARVRRWDPKTGIVTTLAGNGQMVFDGAGKPATKTSMTSPHAVRVEKNGNILVTDSGDHIVYRIDGKTGILSVVAGDGHPGFTGDGGPAAKARLDQSAGLALDKAGNIYVVDWNNNRVRRIDAKTGIITTVVGNGATNSHGEGLFAGDGGPAVNASLFVPGGIAFDSAGNFYIADVLNARIRKVTGL
jgi:sugar lactone lactonase YvrE